MIKNILQLFFSNFIFGLSQLLIIICLNKFGDFSDVGTYSLGLAIVAPITVFLNMGLNIHYNTNKEDANFKNYLLLRFYTNIIIVILSLLVGIFLGYEHYMLLIILLLASLKFIESLLDMSYAYFQKREEHQKIAFSKTLRALFLIVWTLIISIIHDANLIIIILGILIFNLILFSIYDYKFVLKKLSHLKAEPHKIRLIAYTAIPLAISSTFDSLNINAQRILIEKLINVEELGIYSSIMTIMMSGQMFIAAIMTYFLPKLNVYVNTKELNLFKRTMFQSVAISWLVGSVLVVFTAIFGSSLFSVIFRPEYKSYKDLAVLIMIAGLFWYVAGALNYCVLALNLYYKQMFVVIGSFLSMILSSPFLISAFSINGAAIALIISMVIRVLGFIAIIRAYIKGRFYEK